MLAVVLVEHMVVVQVLQLVDLAVVEMVEVQTAQYRQLLVLTD
tara:strand:- start:185 stop:313 length:129 start_codon:yes stop_codon:yes gene_type:complete